MQVCRNLEGDDLKGEVVANPDPISLAKEDDGSDATNHSHCASSPYASSHRHPPLNSHIWYTLVLF